MKKFVTTLVAILMAGIMGSYFMPLPPTAYWSVVIALAVTLGALRASGKLSADPALGTGSGGGFLCDSCKYDHPSTCSRPERPNATRCKDYRRRGV